MTLNYSIIFKSISELKILRILWASIGPHLEVITMEVKINIWSSLCNEFIKFLSEKKPGIFVPDCAANILQKKNVSLLVYPEDSNNWPPKGSLEVEGVRFKGTSYELSAVVEALIRGFQE